MELWLETELRVRRENVLETARRCRNLRLAESGRSSSVRAYAAGAVQLASDALANLARNLRAGEGV
ncbi:MAG TPA: hypothetical protein VMH02_01010 [Verrucomicrobiae bacterium]|nr:hypothetical protein [Verrucomicrobiae bacterium]